MEDNLDINLSKYIVKNLFVCDECNNVFSPKGHFKIHHLNHAGEKSHVCQLCNKEFSKKKNLN